MRTFKNRKEKINFLQSVGAGKIRVGRPKPILFVRQEKSLYEPASPEFIEVNGVLCPAIPDEARFIDTRTDEYLTYTQITALLEEKYKGYGVWYDISDPSWSRFAAVSAIFFKKDSSGVYQHQWLPGQGRQAVIIEKFTDIVQQQECYAEIREQKEKSCNN